MPQMSPMFWTTLFLSFNMVYMYNMMITYFFISYEEKNEMKKNMNKQNMNWKW